MKKKTIKRIKIILFYQPCIYFVLCMIFLILLILLYESPPLNEISIMHSLDKEISTKPWKNIYLQETCPVGTQAQHFGVWSGTRQGYIIKYSDKNYEEKEEKTVGSSKATGVQSNLLSVLANQDNKKIKLCVEYFLDSEFYYGIECDTEKGYHPCNAGVCVKVNGAFNINEHCPVTDIKITNKDFNYEIKRNGHFFIVNLEADFAPLCVNPELLPEKPSKTNYPLSQHYYTGCDKYGSFNDLSTVIYGRSYDCLNHVKTLEANNRKIIADNAPYYSAYIAHQSNDCFKLYQKIQSKITADPICYNINGFNELKAVRSYATSINHLILVYGIICFILDLLGLILIATLFFKKHNIFQSLSKHFHLIALILALFIITFFIHYMAKIYSINNSLITAKTSFQKASDNSCYDKSSEYFEAFKMVLSFLKWNFNFSYFIIILLFTLTMFYLVLLALFYLILKMTKAQPFVSYYKYHY